MTAIEASFSAERLREMLHYCQESGCFTWLARPNKKIKAGVVAGSKRPEGRILIGVLGREYLAHRLAWLYVYGKWPAGVIDHIDGDPGNNSLVNLRDVSKTVNQQNQRRAHSRSTHGFMGVRRNRKRWQALISVDGKIRHLGTFDTPELAHFAYLDAKRLLHVGCTI